MIRLNRRIQYSIWTLAAFLLASCSKPEEEGNDEYRLPYGKVDVTVSVTLPQPEVVKASTRIIGDELKDTYIRNMVALVFDKDAKFMRRVQAKQLKVTENGVSFTMTLDATAEKRVIHLVANSYSYDYLGSSIRRLNVDDLSVGMSEQVAISSLKTVPVVTVGIQPLTAATGYNNAIGPLIMWGRFVLENGTNVTNPITGVKLLRTAAAIQVKKGNVADVDNGLDDFILDRFYLHNAAAVGFLAPMDCTGMVSTPATANPFHASMSIEWWKALVSTPPLTAYVYERDCTPDDYMSIIIGAYYKGILGYYKVVMTDRDGTLLNIIRNHRYTITIVGVNTVGTPRPEEAINLPLGSGQLKVELTNDDTDLPFIAASANELLAMSNNEFIQYGGTGKLPPGPDYAWGRTWFTGKQNICRLYSSRVPDNVYPLVIFNGNTNESLRPHWMRTVHTKRENQYEPNGYYQVVGDFYLVEKAYVSSFVLLRLGDVSLPLRISWYPDIPGEQADGSHVFDLIDPADKNWNVRIENPSSTPWLTLSPSAASSPGYLGNGRDVTELSSKYASHAWLHVGEGRVGNTGMGTILKTSVRDGELKVTKIRIMNIYNQ